MGAVAEAFREGGLWMYLILAIGILTPVWLMVYTLMNVFGRRGRAILWWLGPIAIIVAASLGIGWTITDGTAALQNASPANQMRLVAQVTTTAIHLAAFAGLLNAIFGALISIGAGVSNIFDAPDENGKSWGRAALVGSVSLAGGLGFVAANSYLAESGPMATTVAASLVVGGFGCALAVLPDLDDEASIDLVSRRITAVFGTLCSVTFAVLTSWALGFRKVYYSLEQAVPEHRMELYTEGLGKLDSAVTALGGIGGAMTLVIGALVIGTIADRLSQRAIVIDAIICLAGSIVVALACGYALVQIGAFGPTFDEKLFPSVDNEQAMFVPPPGSESPAGRGGSSQWGN